MNNRTVLRAMNPRKGGSPNQRPSKKKRPTLTVEHRTLGVAQLLAVRMSEDGIYIVDTDFGGTRRAFRLQQEFEALKLDGGKAYSGETP